MAKGALEVIKVLDGVLHLVGKEVESIGLVTGINSSGLVRRKYYKEVVGL